MAKKRLSSKKKTSISSTSKAIRTITASDRGHIADLAEILYSFLPLSTHNNKTQTFFSIFKESKIHTYIPQKTSKKEAMEKALVKLFRYHKKLPYTIFRKIVIASLKYRRYKRNPLKREELNQLDALLQQLDLNISDELAAIELDQIPLLIIIPPSELVKRLENHPLCEHIKSEPLELFKNGHFNESVRKASEKYEVEIQKRTSLSDIGKSLMGKAFNLNAPIIQLNSLTTENEKGIQEGYQFLTMGMIRAMRNIFSHGDENQRTPEEAYEMLLFINWLFRQLPV
ncbi:TIGR02391 family protein [Winogradskyella sp.]|uniref:TIGR02391 family protein n=1 Tax=Winogradskyella sp. TaxID=1883156 RepID=UPI003BAB06D6